MNIRNAFTIISMVLIAITAAYSQKGNKDFSKIYQGDEFYFAAWGEPRGTEEEQKALMEKWSDAGITDLLPENKSNDRLRELIKMGNPNDIRIHDWHWMMNVGGRKEVRENLEWYSVNRLGQNCRDFNPYVSYYNWLSPFSEGAREYIKNGVREKAKIEGLASVHFDYIRYVDVVLGSNLQKKYDYKGGELVQDRLLPEFDFGYHPEGRKQYEEIFGVDPLDMPDVVENAAWKQFRMNAISSLVEECVEICHEEGTAASAAVFPFPQLGREYVKQDWGHWPLDYFFPMIYKWDHAGNVGWVGFATKEGVRDMEQGQHLFTGMLVGHYRNNIEDFEKAIQAAYENGARGVCFFRINSLSDEHLAIVKKYKDMYNKN